MVNKIKSKAPILLTIFLRTTLMFFIIILLGCSKTTIDKKVNRILDEEIIFLGVKEKTEDLSKMNIYLFDTSKKTSRLLIKNLCRSKMLIPRVYLSDRRDKIIFGLAQHSEYVGYLGPETKYLSKIVIYDMESKEKFSLSKKFFLKNGIGRICGMYFSKEESEIYLISSGEDVCKYTIDFKEKEVVGKEIIIERQKDDLIGLFNTYSFIDGNSLYLWHAFTGEMFVFDNENNEIIDRYKVPAFTIAFSSSMIIRDNLHFIINPYSQYKGILVTEREKKIYSKEVELKKYNFLSPTTLGGFSESSSEIVFNDNENIYMLNLETKEVKKYYHYRDEYSFLQVLKWQ